MHADFAQRDLKRRGDAEDADRSGEGGGIRPDFVGSRRDPVPARRGQPRHRHDYRLAGALQALEFRADDFRAERAAAGRIDAHHERLDLGIKAQAAQQFADLIRPRGTAAVVVDQNRAAYREHRDVGPRGGGRLALATQVIAIANLGEVVTRTIRPEALQQSQPHGLTTEQFIDQALLEREPREIALFCCA